MKPYFGPISLLCCIPRFRAYSLGLYPCHRRPKNNKKEGNPSFRLSQLFFTYKLILAASIQPPPHSSAIAIAIACRDSAET